MRLQVESLSAYRTEEHKKFCDFSPANKVSPGHTLTRSEMKTMGADELRVELAAVRVQEKLNAREEVDKTKSDRENHVELEYSAVASNIQKRPQETNGSDMRALVRDSYPTP